MTFSMRNVQSEKGEGFFDCGNLKLNIKSASSLPHNYGFKVNSTVTRRPEKTRRVAPVRMVYLQRVAKVKGQLFLVLQHGQSKRTVLSHDRSCVCCADLALLGRIDMQHSYH